MEDVDWGQPLLNDCLFSEALSSETPELPLPELGAGLEELGFVADDDDLAAITAADLFGNPSLQSAPPA